MPRKLGALPLSAEINLRTLTTWLPTGSVNVSAFNDLEIENGLILWMRPL